MAKRSGPKKGKALQFLEFAAVVFVYHLVRMTPLAMGRQASRWLGILAYYFVPKRRKIAIQNLRHVFGATKSDREVRHLARRSWSFLTISAFEAVKIVSTPGGPVASAWIHDAMQALDLPCQKAKRIHQDSRGCIFVMPHLGNWTLLPLVGFWAGIPAVIVIRPFDNRFLENKFLEEWLAEYRQASGQVFVSRTNSLNFLQTSLTRGKSVTMLPDQSTMKSISVDYLGRKASTTPIPAILAIRYNRPIVVLACCRGSSEFRFEGLVSDPIWPDPRRDERQEIVRLTEAMNHEMGIMVRRYPEQYLWMHDRWKSYRYKGQIALD